MDRWKQFVLFLSDKVAVVKNVRLIPKQTIIYFSQVHSVWTTGRGKGGGEFSGQVCRDRLYWVTTITSSRITTPDLTSYGYKLLCLVFVVSDIH